jgi:hypothetical protein
MAKKGVNRQTKTGDVVPLCKIACAHKNASAVPDQLDLACISEPDGGTEI